MSQRRETTRATSAEAVLAWAFATGAFTASEAIDATGLTRSTVLAACSELVRLGWLRDLDDATAARHRAVLEAVGLPTSYAGEWSKVHSAMRSDKKSRGNRLRFVALDGLARPRMLEDPDPSLLVAAFEEVRKDRSGEVYL